MTGVFVYFNCFDGSKIVVRVTGFEGRIVYGDSEKSSHWCSIKKVEPIPLTPEILEKNGFIHYTDFYMWKEESLEPIHLDNYDEDGWRSRINCDNIPCECKYVHQLQHALKLCGINKTIEL